MVGLGVATPSVDTLSTNIAAAGHRGAITTIYGSVRCIGAAAGPFTMYALMKAGPFVTFWPVTVLGAVISTLVFIFLQDEEVPGKLDRDN